MGWGAEERRACHYLPSTLGTGSARATVFPKALPQLGVLSHKAVKMGVGEGESITAAKVMFLKCKCGCVSLVSLPCNLQWFPVALRDEAHKTVLLCPFYCFPQLRTFAHAFPVPGHSCPLPLFILWILAEKSLLMEPSPDITTRAHSLWSSPWTGMSVPPHSAEAQAGA